MTPCDLNMLVSAISNYLYCTLAEEDFKCLSIILNELSKSMFAMTLYENICTTSNDKRLRRRGKQEPPRPKEKVVNT